MRRFRGLLAVLTVGALLSPTTAQAEDIGDDIPILGQAWVLGYGDAAPNGVLSVHRVARTDNATILYWSIGVPEDSDKGASSYVAAKFTRFYSSIFGSSTGDIALLDAAGGRVFVPLSDDDDECACSSRSMLVDVEPGQVAVAWIAFPPLPEDVSSVGVMAANQVIRAVPVEDGTLEPIAEQEDSRDPVILGTGWPVIDEQLISSMSPQGEGWFPIIQRISNADETLTQSQGMVELTSDVLFATDSHELSKKAAAVIAEAAEGITAKAASKEIAVIGHTDSDGSDSYNHELSERRAKAVARELTKRLGAGFKVSTAGKGESEPIADNGTDAGKAANRRVTITFEQE